jgi:thioredoxin 1
MAENVIEISETNFEQQVIQSESPVLVDFWAPWCGPCRMVAPIVEELAGEYEGKLAVAKVNVDDNQDIAARFGITSIPTLMLFKNGEVAEKVVGMVPKNTLKEAIDNQL